MQSLLLLQKKLNEGTEIFVKTVEKSSDLGKIYFVKKGVWCSKEDGEPIETSHISSAKNILTSDVADIKRDYEGHTNEWRSVVIDDDIFALCKYRTLENEGNPKLIKFIKEKIAENKGKMPSSYIMDIMEVKSKKNKYEIVEFNSITQAGMPVCPDILFEYPCNLIALQDKRQHPIENRSSAPKNEEENAIIEGMKEDLRKKAEALMLELGLAPLEEDKKPEDMSNDSKEIVLDLFGITEVNYSDRHRNLDVKASGKVESTKFFPVYLDENGEEQIFKPLSYTKPWCTPMFAYAEVYWSYLINKYFDQSAPTYQLAFCKGITDEQEKYQEKGTLVNSFLKPGQRTINLLEYYKKRPDENVDIEHYINYCMKMYDYSDILNSDLFMGNKELSKQLSRQILISILSRNQNFHYENVAILCDGKEMISLTPPIDQEFSSMFIYPENQEEHDKLQRQYDELMDTSNVNAITKNIKAIVKKNPEVSKEFITDLQRMKADLQKSSILIRNEEYIGKFSSDDWKVNRPKIKDHDIVTANFWESIVKDKRTEIDTETFASNVVTETIHSADILENVINYYIDKQKGKDDGQR